MPKWNKQTEDLKVWAANRVVPTYKEVWIKFHFFIKPGISHWFSYLGTLNHWGSVSFYCVVLSSCLSSSEHWLWRQLPNHVPHGTLKTVQIKDNLLYTLHSGHSSLIATTQWGDPENRFLKSPTHLPFHFIVHSGAALSSNQFCMPLSIKFLYLILFKIHPSVAFSFSSSVQPLNIGMGTQPHCPLSAPQQK